METNLLNILIALGDTAAPVVLGILNHRKELAGRVEVSSRMYIHNKKSLDALVMFIVDAVDALANLPKDPSSTDGDVINFLRCTGDLERNLPLYPIDENALAPLCAPEPIKYDVRDIVDDTMRDTIMTLIKVTIKYCSLPYGLRSITDDIIWKRMCSLVALIAELLVHTYNCIRERDITPPWIFNDHILVARRTQIFLPGNFTVTLLKERKYFTEAEEAAIREEENERLEEEARSKELMELEQQLPETFRQEETLKELHFEFDTKELIKMVRNFLAFFSRTSINATYLLDKLNSPEVSFIDLFYTATYDDVVCYADVGRAFKLFDAVLKNSKPESRLTVCDTDGGGEFVFRRNSELYSDIFVSDIESPVPDNWMLTIKTK